MIHLLIPMSGTGSRYQAAGYKDPKPLIPVSGRPMIARVLEMFPRDWPAHFVLSEAHRPTRLAETLRELRPDGHVYKVAPHAEGPLRAIEAALAAIPEDDAVFVSYCDYGMVWDRTQFERFVTTSGCDACLVSYRGFHAHYPSPVPYAYSRLEGERVREVREKGSFTDQRENEYASTGGYYFRTRRLLQDAIAHQRAIDLRVKGEFYTSLTVESLLRLHPDADVRVFEIPGFFQWGTPDDLRDFEYWERTFAAYNRGAGRAGPKVDQLLMPMAGKGSRFAALTDQPKPLIPVLGEPMFERALRSLPQAGASVFVGLEGMRGALPARAGRTYVFLDDTPVGQALSTERGSRALEPERPVVVSSCDHEIVLEPKRWSRFTAAPDCDAAIFVVRGFPGVARSPKSYAYVVPERSGEEFARVRNVSVKTPVSDTPRADALLIGTFWFSKASLIPELVAELREKDRTVNGEYYLDSVFELLIARGRTVRWIEVDGYVNWGDPASLSEGLYWYENFVGRRVSRRAALPNLREV